MTEVGDRKSKDRYQDQKMSLNGPESNFIMFLVCYIWLCLRFWTIRGLIHKYRKNVI